MTEIMNAAGAVLATSRHSSKHETYAALSESSHVPASTLWHREHGRPSKIESCISYQSALLVDIVRSERPKYRDLQDLLQPRHTIGKSIDPPQNKPTGVYYCIDFNRLSYTCPITGEPSSLQLSTSVSVSFCITVQTLTITLVELSFPHTAWPEFARFLASTFSGEERAFPIVAFPLQDTCIQTSDMY
jgi:hypothetical protein